MSQMFNRKRALLLPFIAALLLCVLDSAAANSISFLDSFRNLANTQTGNGNSLTSTGAFYSADLNSATPNAYSAVTMSYPGSGSPVGLSQLSPTDYHYQSAGFANQAAMDLAFPHGTYAFTTNTPDAANFLYAADDYARSLPYLTGTDYTSLQGLNANNAFTFHFSPDTTGPNASASFIFFTVFDSTLNTLIFNAGFLPATTTSVTIAANTLRAGDNFVYEIDFSNRDNLSGNNGAEFPPQLGFDVRTAGTFRTQVNAVPEPTAVSLFGIGIFALLAFYRRRRAEYTP